jgi:hypothetical protein
MPRSRSTTPDAEDEETGEASAEGVVIRQRLVAPAPGRASGTFTAVGAVSAQGTAVTDAFVPARPHGPVAPSLVDGSVRLSAPAGEIVLTISTVLRLVPDTGVLTGGGTWNVTRADGDYDGLRANGSLTLVVVYDAAGSATLDLVLTGRVPSSARGGERRVSDP